MHTLIFSTKARLSSLYPALVLTIANISPHVKNLSVAASTKLIQLFLAFSAPSFLLMEEGNPRLVYYLLETFNNVIHEQLSDNSNLTYAIIRAHKRFEELSTFTLSSAVAEARKSRADRRAASSSSTTTTTAVTTASNGDPSEKARGKMRASSSTASIPTLSQTEEDESEPREMVERRDEAPFVGKHGFVPTEAWVSSWRSGLPLDSIMILLAELRPRIFDIGSDSPHESPGRAIDFLKSASLAGLLPETDSTAFRKRKFLDTPQSIAWLASLVYGSVYVSSLELVREVPVQLFTVATLPRKASPAADLVSGAANLFLSKVKQ